MAIGNTLQHLECTALAPIQCTGESHYSCNAVLLTADSLDKAPPNVEHAHGTTSRCSGLVCSVGMSAVRAGGLVVLVQHKVCLKRHATE